MKMTYEELLRAMLDRVPDTVDKREGSIIYDALAPCAYFLAQQNFQLDNFVDLVFPDTAVGEYLDRAVDAYGITRKEATAAVRKMVASAPVQLGSRWEISSVIYVVTGELEEANTYEVTCETAGDIGNQYSGAMIPASAGISGVTAELTDSLVAGTDREADEALRERFYAKVRLPATSGNAYHYKQWALEVPGVGDAKVFPLDHGPGTVSVLVVDDEKNISFSLPDTVAAHIEEMRPIGAKVTVSNPETFVINISANVLLDKSRTISEVQREFEASVDAFLKDTIFSVYRISQAKLGSILLEIPGVEDFDTLTLNGTSGNAMVSEKQIPVKGTVTLSEVKTLGTDEAATGLL